MQQAPAAPALSEQDLARLHSALAKQEAWTAKAFQEQQALYMRLHGAEAQLQEVDAAASAAAAARPETDAQDQPEVLLCAPSSGVQCYNTCGGSICQLSLPTQSAAISATCDVSMLSL